MIERRARRKRPRTTSHRFVMTVLAGDAGPTTPERSESPSEADCPKKPQLDSSAVNYNQLTYT
jgi:hypothetical protein